MSSGTIIWIIVALLVICCLSTHRRVIKALFTGTEMPKAPKWHFWVPKKKKRS